MSIPQVVLIGMAIGALFILIRDVVATLSPKGIAGTAFGSLRYVVYSIAGGIVGLVVNFMWNL